MGQCLGRTSNANFRGEGRTLGSSAGPAARPVPAPAPAPAGPGPASGDGGGGGGGGDARSAAARAAEERAARSKADASRGGKLAQNLAAQKARTTEDTLRDGAETARRQREVDQGTRELAHA